MDSKFSSMVDDEKTRGRWDVSHKGSFSVCMLGFSCLLSCPQMYAHVHIPVLHMWNSIGPYFHIVVKPTCTSWSNLRRCPHFRGSNILIKRDVLV